MKTMFMRPWILGFLLLSFTLSGHAQMYGTGMMAGMQSCPYPQNIGDEAESIQDQISDLQEELRSAKSDLREEESERRSLESKLKRIEGELKRRGLQGDYLAKVIDHIREGRSCTEYSGYVPNPKARPAQGRPRTTSMNDEEMVDENAEEANQSRMPASTTKPKKPAKGGMAHKAKEPIKKVI